MTRANVSAALVLIALAILFGIGGAAEDRPLNATDCLLALTGMACLALGTHIEKGRNRL